MKVILLFYLPLLANCCYRDYKTGYFSNFDFLLLLLLILLSGQVNLVNSLVYLTVFGGMFLLKLLIDVLTKETSMARVITDIGYGDLKFFLINCLITQEFTGIALFISLIAALLYGKLHKLKRIRLGAFLFLGFASGFLLKFLC